MVSSVDSLAPEHRNGFSALPLMAPCEARRVVYLLEWRTALVAHDNAAGGGSAMVKVAGWSALPFTAGSIDVIVADLDRAATDSQDVRELLASEFRRVLAETGRVIAVVTHKRRARDPHDWAGYRLWPPAIAWRRALADAGLAQLDAARLQFDGARVVRIDAAPRPLRNGLPEGTADAVALVLGVNTSAAHSTLEELSQVLHRDLGIEATLDRVHVRKIGKAAAFVSHRGVKLLVRLPCSPVARERARRNHAALDAVHALDATRFPLDIVPEAVGAGQVGSRQYFLETVVPGIPREGRLRGMRWESQAVEWITALHAATARIEPLTTAWFAGELEPYFTDIESVLTGDEDRMAVRWLREAIRDRLVGQAVPLVRSHGDFTDGNCLYDPHGRLSGVVDWELSRETALPLLDLLQCFDLPAEYVGERWVRADLVLEAASAGGALLEAPEIARYARTLGLPTTLLAPLMLAYWVDHVGCRIRARSSDRRWMQRRVHAPLDRVRQLAGR